MSGILFCSLTDKKDRADSPTRRERPRNRDLVEIIDWFSIIALNGNVMLRNYHVMLGKDDF
ncbi:MAG: hypothetical protein MK076_10620 [Flavobacteriales bacterium]|nr:hypothetical protein [Flavobacteriales bacterium]